jgi:hypothetical protein
VIHGRIEPGLVDPKPGSRVALWVEVDEEGRALGEGQAGRKVDGRGCLADPALLVYDGDGLSYVFSPRSDLMIKPYLATQEGNRSRLRLARQDIFVFHAPHYTQ